MKTKRPSTFNLQPSAFVLLATFTLFTTAPLAPAQGFWGNALSFDGVNDYVDLGTNAPVLGTHFTQEAWIKSHDLNGFLLGVLGYSPPTGERYRSPCIFMVNVTDLHIGFGTGSAWNYWFVRGVVQPYEWNHVAASYDGAVYRVYVNGLQIFSTNIVAVPANTPVRYIGQIDGWEFHGLIDEVRLWNVARTATEIRQDMFPSHGTEPGLVGYWKFDEVTDTTAHDATTNHFDGALLNGPTWTSSTLPGFTNLTATVAPGLPGVYRSSVAWGDLDNDGRLDILLAGYTGSSRISQVWRNTGSGFANVTATVAPGLPGVEYSSVAWGDYDNDGRLDFLLTGSTGSGFISQLWRNTGSGFANVTATVAPGLSGVGDGSVAWGDYDNDGRLDFLLTGYAASGGISQVWRNTGSGFSNETATVAPGLPGVFESSVAWGDYDNDGRLDFLLTGSMPPERFSQVWRNTGSGFVNVTATVAPSLPGVVRGSVVWGDYDNDGRLDFLLTGYAAPGSISQLWRNTGSGFANVTATVAPGLPGVGDCSVAWGDYDNDGQLDILLTGSSASGSISQLWRNTGSGFVNVTATVASGLLGVYESSVASGDYDNDGRLDFLLTGYLNPGRVTQLWRNIGCAANAQPTSPGTSAVTVAGSTVNLSWMPGADVETPASGLTYNVRVGSTPGGSDIVSAQASSAGFRRLPALGNGQQRLSIPLATSLTGQFYWSVQAVDTAFAGSPFSAESSFTLWPTLGPGSGPVPGDTTGDGTVDSSELAAVVARHGMVTQSDLDLVLSNYWPQSPWIALTNIAGLGTTRVTFALTNSTAGVFSVETSTNLTDWEFLGPATPRYEFTDTNAPVVPQRAYRLRWP